MVVVENTSHERALRALRCSVLTARALVRMRTASIPLADFVGVRGVDQGFTQTKVSELAAEDDLMWLIKVGVLRREVDGQGITDRFRLTPMGSELSRLVPPEALSPLERGYDWLLRRLPY
ncbi:Npun_F0494 family protein [Anthocerotibacter panamensis]|uniref:Npun_F0494 family protein n=1 Tax=Anthocerotibacter panamensis TaxID=2857077 RepID=UPI001C402886|nr:Npun_F0494 family protein [Anthocerotibacter panamensis]